MQVVEITWFGMEIFIHEIIILNGDKIDKYVVLVIMIARKSDFTFLDDRMGNYRALVAGKPKSG
jgi:hypothetical protein